MNKISQHKLLVAGNDFAHCSEKVRRFFDLTSLVIYDCIEPDPEKSTSGLDASFFEAVDQAILDNKQLVQGLIRELKKSGINEVEDLGAIEQGYASKTLHIITHFLDGFVGIDSHFYNLIDDSHWLPKATVSSIKKEPDKFWLIHIDCFAATAEEAGILHR